jgi:hypothetical protein
LTLALEAVAGEFFRRIPAFCDRVGAPAGLKYFGKRHLEVEQNHSVFGEGHSKLASIAIPERSIPEILKIIERTFEVMGTLADDFETAMRDEAQVASGT